MEVILLENISNLGTLGDKVNVKAGFGRNYLVPQGKAVPATATSIAEFEARRADLEAAAAATLAAAEARAEGINALGLISIPANAGEVDKSEVRLPEGALRDLGEYEIAIQVHGDVTAAVAIAVIPEE